MQSAYCRSSFEYAPTLQRSCRPWNQLVFISFIIHLGILSISKFNLKSRGSVLPRPFRFYELLSSLLTRCEVNHLFLAFIASHNQIDFELDFLLFWTRYAHTKYHKFHPDFRIWDNWYWIKKEGKRFDEKNNICTTITSLKTLDKFQREFWTRCQKYINIEKKNGTFKMSVLTYPLV